MFEVKYYFLNIKSSFYYITNGSVYLWKDWTIQECTYRIGENKFDCGCWKTEKDAQDFLDTYLKGIPVKNNEIISTEQSSVSYDERLKQCDKDIAALQIEKEKILKEKAESEVKKFYLGNVFVIISNNYRFFLARTPDDYVALIQMDGPDRGYVFRYMVKLPIEKDCYGWYVTKLPTTYPQDFGFDKRYGV